MKYWKRLVWGLAAVLCLLGALLLRHGDQAVIRTLTPQLAAQRWETEDKPYAMVSVFLPDDSAIPQSRISEIRLSVENALTDGGVGSDTHPWLYSASYQTTATLRSETASCEALLTAVTGDYFRIHPMPVRSGWYMEESELMHDRVVLSRQAAWDLFASDHVEGLLLELNGVYYQVAAVVDLEEGKFNDLAAGTTPRAWVFADSPATSPAADPSTVDAAGPDGGLSSAPGFTCMEMVLPQPVKDFAATTMKNALNGLISEQTEITDNSERFSLSSRFQVLKSLSVRGISSDAVEYPYYENAARLAENHLAIRLVPEGLLLCVPILSLLIVLILLNRKRTWGFHSIKDAVENAIDRKHQRDYYGTVDPQPNWEYDWDPPWTEDDAFPYDEDNTASDRDDAWDYDSDEPYDEYGDYDAYSPDEAPEVLPVPSKSKQQRRRDRRIKRRKAKRRRQARQRAKRNR